jgi:hypothetical protein
MDALKSFPKTDTKLYTEKGTAVCQKTDIFKGYMWFAYEGEWMNWHKITTKQANEIIELNQQKKKIASLEEYASDLIEDTKAEFENVVGQDSLTRFDSPKRNKKRKNNRRKGHQNNKKAAPNNNAKSNNRNPNQNNRRKNNKRKPQNSKNAAK